MRLRLALVLSSAAVLGATSFASAQPSPPVPVYLHVGSDGVCFAISQQVPHCVPVNVVSQQIPVPPVSLPYRKGDEICYDPTPTSKGPCVPLPSTG